MARGKDSNKKEKKSKNKLSDSNQKDAKQSSKLTSGDPELRSPVTKDGTLSTVRNNLFSDGSSNKRSQKKNEKATDEESEESRELNSFEDSVQNNLDNLGNNDRPIDDIKPETPPRSVTSQLNDNDPPPHIAEILRSISVKLSPTDLQTIPGASKEVLQLFHNLGKDVDILRHAVLALSHTQKPATQDDEKQQERDRKEVSKNPFTGEKGLLLFKEDIRAQCLHRTMWNSLLTITHGNDTHFIPDDFLKLPENVMGKARRGRTGPEQLAARNMYTALWMSLSSRVKTTIIESKKLYKQDGPSLLYYLL